MGIKLCSSKYLKECRATVSPTMQEARASQSKSCGKTVKLKSSNCDVV